MSVECGMELSRKINIDYTTNQKDEERHLIGEKLGNSLFVENSKVKREKSPSSSQNNADEMTADNSRLNAEKKNDNNHTAQSDGNGKRSKTPLCYDFKKGMCRRRFCRYPHAMTSDQVVFCHDFQNNGCFRSNCRFIHRTIEDEEHYRAYGVFPTERPTIVPNMNQSDHHIAPPSLPPPHLNYGYANRENMMTNPPPQSNQQPSFTQNSSMPLVSRRRSFGMTDNNNHETIIPSKRSHMEDLRSTTVPTYNTQNNDAAHQCRFVEQNVGQAVNAQSTTVPTSVVITEDVINIYRLYEEHNLLRRRVEINEERLQELRATNTYLLQQNEQLRRQTQCSCTNTIVNPVTLTTASQQSATPVLNAVSIAPVQMQATPIVSIASIAQPQTQIIASSAPIAIAATTSQGQQLALASGTQVVQQASTGQIIGTPAQITLATAPSMGITMNTSQPIAMSNATQPIISYPVMTHSILPH
ncbi:zinc finger CCCH domain-containing protein 10-like [Contarinia nasturtii]|uniref:zinc finger CCCH domain-containing protein 10-like n=1 Tax=Contarinia nasturtii TaxID=265458 RepID=UPI0012D3AADD|nr:zinc finger CCCH domain-containing protein 10-like [Contarinia nasturtii]